MKVRILFLFALVLTLSMATASSVQARQSAQEREEFKATLGLTQQQKDDWAALEKSMKIKRLRIEQSDLSDAEKTSKLRAVKRSEVLRLKRILTQEQWNKWAAFLKEHKDN